MNLYPDGPRLGHTDVERPGTQADRDSVTIEEQKILDEIRNFSDDEIKHETLLDIIETIKKLATPETLHDLKEQLRYYSRTLDYFTPLTQPEYKAQCKILWEQCSRWLAELDRVNADAWMALDKLCSCMLKLWYKNRDMENTWTTTLT